MPGLFLVYDRLSFSDMFLQEFILLRLQSKCYQEVSVLVLLHSFEIHGTGWISWWSAWRKYLKVVLFLESSLVILSRSIYGFLKPFYFLFLCRTITTYCVVYEYQNKKNGVKCHPLNNICFWEESMCNSSLCQEHALVHIPFVFAFYFTKWEESLFYTRRFWCQPIHWWSYAHLD